MLAAWFSQSFLALGSALGLLAFTGAITWLIGVQLQQWARRWTVRGQMQTRITRCKIDDDGEPDGLAFPATPLGRKPDTTVVFPPKYLEAGEAAMLEMVPKSPPPQF